MIPPLTLMNAQLTLPRVWMTPQCHPAQVKVTATGGQRPLGSVPLPGDNLHRTPEGAATSSKVLLTYKTLGQLACTTQQSAGQLVVELL